MGKLVRDGIPDIIRDSGREPSVRQVYGDELRSALKDKLVEEALELKGSEDIVEELADVLEVVDALIEMYGLDLNEVERIMSEKRNERGGFKQGYYLE